MTASTVTEQMLIRQPPATVYNAFANPAETAHFWFTHSNSVLQTGKTVTWTWEMYNLSTPVLVIEMIPAQKIIIEWGEGDGKTTVEFHFEPMPGNSTLLKVKQYGFTQKGDDLIKTIADNTGGFATVLAGAKVYLEYGINPNLIADKFPKGH